MKKYLLYIISFVVLALVGCQEIPKSKRVNISTTQFKSSQSIQEYLRKNVANIGFHGKAYCAYEVLDAQENSEHLSVYTWVVCQEYYSSGKELRKGTGASIPVALNVQRTGNRFTVINHRVPGDGVQYLDDLTAIFSQPFRDKLQSETTKDRNQRVRRLQNEIENEAGING